MLDQDQVNGTTGDGSNSSALTGASAVNRGGKKENINSGYVFIHATVLALAMFQFGVGIGSWNAYSLVFQYNKGWTADDATKYGTWITVTFNIGALIGSFGSSMLTSNMTKKSALHVLNVLVTIGIGLQLVDSQLVVIIIGKFLQGFCAGGFSAIGPGFVGDISPPEINGPVGGVNQAILTLGILMPAVLALPIPDVSAEMKAGDGNYGDKYADDYLVSSYWIWIVIIPGLFALLQSILLLTCFNYDSPIEMKKANNGQNLLHLMRRIYKTEGEAQLRMDQVVVPAADEGAGEEQIGLFQVFSDPRYSKTTWIGILTLTFAQLTGMNGIMFYGSQLFSGGSISPFLANFMVNGVNFLSTFVSMGVLAFIGKRPAMIFAQSLCFIGMILAYVFTGPSPNDTLLLVVVLIFILGFELGPGSIGWPYVAEICHPRGVTWATCANWFWTLVVGYCWPYMNTSWFGKGVAFLIFGAISFVGVIFFIVFMKETRGKTKEEIERMFRPNAPTVYKRVEDDITA